MARNSVLSKFEELSINFSSKIAVYYVSDTLSTFFGISHSELNRVSTELSEYFLKFLKINRQYIGVCCNDRMWIPCLLLSIWKSGNAFAGIGCHSTREENLRFINRLKVRYIITDVENDDYNARLVSNFQINNQKFFLWERQNQEEIRFSHWDMCFGIMTSGSTGFPKVIQVPWDCIVPNAEELKDVLEINSFDKIYQSSPYTFDPFFVDIFMFLITGASISFVSEKIKFSYDELLNILFFDNADERLCSNKEFKKIKTDSQFYCDIKIVKTIGITVMQTTPSLFLRWGEKNIEKILCKSKLRVLVLGGEKFPTNLAKYKTSVNIFNIYGITEISCWAFISKVSNHSEVSIGKPLKDITYKIIENEFYIGSKVRKCLVNDEEFFDEDQVVFRETGDLMRIINDDIFYVSRTNQIIKKYGIKVDLSKIEKKFFNMANVEQCCCVFDDSCNKLILFLVFNPLRNLEKDYFVLKPDENLRGIISELDNIEKPDLLIEISAIPINNNGKCDRRKLLKIARNLIKDSSVNEKNLRKLFCDIWCDALNLSSAESSSSFLELGGNSFSAMRMTMKLNDAGVNTPKKFLADLLINGNFDSCLNNLMTESVENIESPAKKFKKGKELSLKILWKFDLKKCVDAPPTVAEIDGSCKVFVGAHSSLLTSIDAETGIENWTMKLGDRIESGCCIHESKSLGFVGCYDHFAYCVSLFYGTVNWKFETGDMVKSTPCLSSDRESVFVASYDGYLYRLAVDDGILEEKLKISEKGIYSSGITSDDLKIFYIGTLDNSCVALNQNTNEIVWRSRVSSPVFASPCLIKKNNQIQALFIEVLGIVHAYSADTGDKLWHYESNGNVYSSPSTINVNNQYYVNYGCHDRNLYCLQINSEPVLKSKLACDSAIFASPRINNNELITVASTKGTIYIINFESSEILTSLQLNGEIFSTPCFRDDRLFVGCRDNNLYCIQLEKK